ncbi:MAG: apolipoprotein N-acyltransferase [Pseudomonadota bacterium]
MLNDVLRRWPVSQSILAGFVLPLAFAPFNFWWLAPLVVAWSTMLWTPLSSRDAFRAGFAFGFAAFLFGTYWIYNAVAVFGGAPLWLAIVLMLGLVLIMALYYGLIALGIARLRPTVPVWAAPFAIASLWVLAEWCRGWILSGFPWLSLGYSQLSSPFAGFAPLVGVYGVSAAVVVVGVALLAVPMRPRATAAFATVTIVVVIVGGWLASLREWSEPSGERVRVALVQGAITQDRKWLPESFEPTLRLYRDLTLRNTAADVVVWPEVALPARRQNLGPYLANLDVQLRRTNTALAYGIIDYDAAAERYYNALVALGEGSGNYRKHHLVPFGEYFPVPPFIREWMKMMSLPYADMSAGPASQAPLILSGRPVAVSICYEDAFATEQHHMFPDAEYIVNVTNDAWFGETIAPYHHLDIARFRSLESGRAQLRVANTGVTAIIGPDGALVAELGLFEQGVLDGSIEPRRGNTPYLVVGNWPIIVAAALLLAVLIARRRTVS